MNTHDKIELPPLPTGYKSYEFPDGGYDEEKMRTYALSAIQADRKRRDEHVDLDRYDAGLLGGQDGMPAYVWHDIIRAELDRAYDFYVDQLDRSSPQPADPVVKESLTVAEPVKVGGE